MTDPFSVPSPTAAAGARLVLLVTLAAFSWDSSAAHAQPEAPELDRDPPRDDADAELSDAELEALFETVARDVTSPPPRTRAPARRRTELRDEDLTLREVVVTGTRRETPIEDSPVQTEVISRADIETSGAETLAELLEEQAGPRTGPRDRDRTGRNDRDLCAFGRRGDDRDFDVRSDHILPNFRAQLLALRAALVPRSAVLPRTLPIDGRS